MIRGVTYLLLFLVLVLGCMRQKSGIDVENFDTTVNLKDDFYQYVNGNWLNNTEIPEEKSNYGAFSALADDVTSSLTIPTIGIGAGSKCDGQILVTQDMLGLFEAFKPKFVKRYAELAETIRSAVGTYAKEVKQGEYPSAQESY